MQKSTRTHFYNAIEEVNVRMSREGYVRVEDPKGKDFYIHRVLKKYKAEFGFDMKKKLNDSKGIFYVPKDEYTFKSMKKWLRENPPPAKPKFLPKVKTSEDLTTKRNKLTVLIQERQSYSEKIVEIEKSIVEILELLKSS